MISIIITLITCAATTASAVSRSRGSPRSTAAGRGACASELRPSHQRHRPIKMPRANAPARIRRN
eukprot:615649-Prymnesium_polylepis.2